MNIWHFSGAIFALAVSGLSMGSAHAATRDQQSSACRGDALRYCLIDIPSETKITACMKKNVERLSPDCRAMFDQDKQPENPVAAPKATTADE